MIDRVSPTPVRGQWVSSTSDPRLGGLKNTPIFKRNHSLAHVGLYSFVSLTFLIFFQLTELRTVNLLKYGEEAVTFCWPDFLGVRIPCIH